VDRICIASSGEDFEAWYPWTEDRSPTPVEWNSMLAPLKELGVIWDDKRPMGIETWPEYGETLAKEWQIGKYKPFSQGGEDIFATPRFDPV
jgi:hypothetical protein